MSENYEETPLTGLEVAVIGMAGRFPGAKNIDELWEKLKDGEETISFFSDEEMEAVGIDAETLKNPAYIKAKGVMPGAAYFDASFFDYTLKEADMMDPQLRILHECSHEALENAAYVPGTYGGPIGFYAGGSSNFYWLIRSMTVPGTSSEQIEALSFNDINFLATRIAYKLDLKGPGFTVQTACSTSLVAVHLACQGLLSGECDIALAGGVSLRLPEKTGYIYQDGMINSPDGRCRAFDAAAKGTNSGDGVGIVVLKRLEDAVDDGDFIHAVIKGSAINNDGLQKVGFTAPSVEGQAAVIREAHRVAKVEPESIRFIEAHGTGTPLGDPIEIKALTKAFATDKKAFCAVGSIKSTMGHLDAAAGVASLIKAVLALEHRLIPPTVSFEVPNPAIAFVRTPFYVGTMPVKLEKGKYPLRAGVSAFGLGGTNAHMVLEEAPRENVDTVPSRHPALFLLSAKTPTALDRVTENLAGYLKDHPGVNPADVTYTLQVGRKAFKHRRMLLCRGVGEAVEAFSNPDSPDIRTSVSHPQPGPVVFMFSEPGPHYVNMGRDLYREDPVFQEELDRCFQILQPFLGYNLKTVFYPADDGEFTGRQTLGDAFADQKEIIAPLVFSFQYALAKLLIHRGIHSEAMIGSGAGEYTAACLSGVFSPGDALDILTSPPSPGENPFRGSSPGTPQIPYISHTTGTWITVEEAADPGYWTDPSPGTGWLETGITQLLEEEGAVFVEIGPGGNLSRLVEEHRHKDRNRPVVAPVKDAGAAGEQPDTLYLWEQIGSLWLHGVTVDWGKCYPGEKRRRIPLPTYPFDRREFDIRVPLSLDFRSHPASRESVEETALYSRTDLPENYIAPRNDMEKKIASIFHEIFGTDTIGVDEDFFELGGDSLKAITVTSKIHKAFNVIVPLQEMFVKATIENLARCVEEASEEKFSSLEPVEKRDYYPVSSVQRRMYFLQKMDAENKSYNIPIVLLLEGDVDKEPAERLFKTLITRHESFRTYFVQVDGEPVQRISTDVPFEVEYFEAEEGSERAREILDSFDGVFDMGKAPLLRAGLMKVGPRRYIMMNNFHHSIFDGFSLGIFVKELMAVYNGEPLPELMFQYKEFARWQATEEQEKRLKKQEEYWLREFSGELPVLELPIDYVRPEVISFEGSRLDFKIDSHRTRVLNALAFDEGATLYMVLLSIYTVFLSKITGQEDIIVGTSVACRRHENLLSIVGMFVNALAMRNYPAGEKNFNEFLMEVKVRTLEAFDNQDYPFEDLVEKVLETRDNSRNPIFDVMFVLNNEELQEVEVPGLKLTAYEHDNPAAQMDLKLRVREKEGEIFLCFEYSTRLFKKESMETYVTNFLEVVSAVVEDRNIKLKDIGISHDLLSTESNILQSEEGDFVF